MYYLDKTTGTPYIKTLNDVIVMLNYIVHETDKLTINHHANGLDHAVNSIIRLIHFNKIKEVSVFDLGFQKWLLYRKIKTNINFKHSITSNFN